MLKRRPRFYEKLSISRILLSFVQLRPVDLLRNSHCWLGKMQEQSSPNRNPQSLQSQDILVAGERNRSVARVDHWPWNGHRPIPTSLWSNTHSSLWRITCEMWRHKIMLIQCWGEVLGYLSWCFINLVEKDENAKMPDHYFHLCNVLYFLHKWQRYANWGLSNSLQNSIIS